MSNTNIRIARIATTIPNKFIDVEVYYLKGGISILGGNSKPRGIYMSAVPVTVEAGFQTRTYSIFSGNCIFVEEQKRFNAKRLEAVAKTIVDEKTRFKNLANMVAAEGKLTLKETQ